MLTYFLIVTVLLLLLDLVQSIHTNISVFWTFYS